MDGLGYLLQSVLNLSGVNVDEFKAQTTNLVQRFIEQDEMLREIRDNQRLIIAHFNLKPEGENVGRQQIHGSLGLSLASGAERQSASG